VGEQRDRMAERVGRADTEALGEILERADRTADGGGRAAAGGDEPMLVARAQAGDALAREQLIDRLLPLVSSLARAFRREGLDQTDLIQEGIVGLLRALERFDPAHGVPFAAFATWWIRRSLQDARSDFIRPFRLPPKALRQLSQLKSEHQRIYQAEQRSAGVPELADRTHIDPEQAQALAVADARVRSLDEPIEGGRGEVGDVEAGAVADVALDVCEGLFGSSREVGLEVRKTLRGGHRLGHIRRRGTRAGRQVVERRFGDRDDRLAVS